MSNDSAISGYSPGEIYCEIFGRSGPRRPSHTRPIRDRLAELTIAQLRARARGAENELFNLGITFTVYTDRKSIDRILPFDVIPRVLSPRD